MKSEIKRYKIRLKKGDTVMVRSGKYKGKTGKILAVHPSLNKVTVERINVVKKHQKPTRSNAQGGIIELTKPIDVSKVGILDPVANKPSRIGMKLEGDKKTRVFKTNGKTIADPKPAEEKKK
jgi:large subunit ribosomal protein L24